MIEAHVGLPGSGKTLHATARLISAKKQGRRALANFHCQSDLWQFALWDQMIDSTNCLAVIDEAHMWFSSRKWHLNDQVDLAAFQQHRKQGMDIIWIAQHESRVDVAVREVTAFIWRHRRLGRVVIASKVTPDDPKKVIGRRCVMVRPILYNNYFTEEVIGFRDGTGYKFGAGSAYKRSAGRGPALDETGRLMPTHWRLEFPATVKYIAVDDPLLSDELAFALLDWRVQGHKGGPEHYCRPVYRGSSGRFVELNDEGEVLPREVAGDLFDDAMRLFEELRKVRLSQLGKLTNPGQFFPKSPLPSLLGIPSESVKSVAVAPMVRAGPVAKFEPGQSDDAKSQQGGILQDLTDSGGLPKAFRFRGDLGAASSEDAA